MPNLSQATIAGHLAADAELRYTDKGTAVLTFRMAVNVRRKNRDTQEWEDAPLWWRVSHFGQQAERLAERLQRGAAVLCLGRMDAGVYTSREGEARLSLDLVASEVTPLDRAATVQADAAPASARAPAPVPSTRRPMPQAAAVRELAGAAAGRGRQPALDDLDDLPF